MLKVFIYKNHRYCY